MSDLVEERLQFAKRLREARERRQYRPREFARMLGVEERKYTRYERAEVEVPVGLLKLMCAVLGVSADELLGLELADRQSRL